MFSYNKFTEAIVNAGLTGAIFSIHGHNKKLHDTLTQTSGSFKQTIIGVKNLIKNGIPVSVNIVINSQNLYHLKQIVMLLSKIGIKKIYFSCIMLCSNKETNDKLFVDSKKVKLELPKSIEYCIKMGILPIIEKYPLCVDPKHAAFFMDEADKENFITQL